MANLQRLAGGASRELWSLDLELPSASGDPERLQQLFLNLFMNAVDAMPDGGELRVALKSTAEGNVRITVTDDGQGIPERDLPRIFEPFFTSKEAGTGNGLGLMVANGTVLTRCWARKNR